MTAPERCHDNAGKWWQGAKGFTPDTFPDLENREFHSVAFLGLRGWLGVIDTNDGHAKSSPISVVAIRMNNDVIRI